MVAQEPIYITNTHKIWQAKSALQKSIFSESNWAAQSLLEKIWYMAQAMASMAGLRGTSQAVLEGSLQLSGSNRLLKVPSNTARVAVALPGLTVKAQQQVSAEPETSRRGMLGLVAAGLASGSFVQAVLAAALPIKVGPPPAPSGGLRKFMN